MSDSHWSVTELASFVRLQCCPRYLALKKSKKSKNQEVRNTEKMEDIDPWLKEEGERHESAFEQHLCDLGLQKCNACQPADAECTHATTPLGEDWFAREVEVQGDIAGLTVEGRIDFLINLDGNWIIAECKASMQDKTYQRFQAAIYSLLVQSGKMTVTCPHSGKRTKPCKRLDAEIEAHKLKVMVVRKTSKSGKLQTFALNGKELELNPESQKDEADDESGNLPQPRVQEAELEALQEDIKTIARKIVGLGLNCEAEITTPAPILLPRCGACDFNSECLRFAKDRAISKNGTFGFEILTYSPKGATAIQSALNKNENEGTLPEVSLCKIENAQVPGIHPPPKQLVPVRQAYYQLLESNPTQQQQPEIMAIPGRVPHIPNPEGQKHPFLQFFISLEKDPTNHPHLGAIALRTRKFPVESNQAPDVATHCWTKWTSERNGSEPLVCSLVAQIKKEVDSVGKPFYAHFYFWSVEEKILLANSLDEATCENAKELLDWISRHEYLREPNIASNGKYKSPLTFSESKEELVCSHLEEEISRSCAVGCIGKTLLEVSSLNWPSDNNGVRSWVDYWCKPIWTAILKEDSSMREILSNIMLFSDAPPPSLWRAENSKDAIGCHFATRVQVLAEIESTLRSSIFKDDRNQHFITVSEEKVCNDSFPEHTTESMVLASRNMLLIETMHRKDRWLKEVSSSVEAMETTQRAVRLKQCPAWNIW